MGEPWVRFSCHIMAHIEGLGNSIMLNSIHILGIGLYIWSVGVSLKQQRNYAWVLVLLSSHMHLELGVCEQGMDANMGAGCMHGLNNPFQLLVRTMSTGDSASDLPHSSSGGILKKRSHKSCMPIHASSFSRSQYQPYQKIPSGNQSLKQTKNLITVSTNCIVTHGDTSLSSKASNSSLDKSTC